MSLGGGLSFPAVIIFHDSLLVREVSFLIKEAVVAIVCIFLPPQSTLKRCLARHHTARRPPLTARGGVALQWATAPRGHTAAGPKTNHLTKGIKQSRPSTIISSRCDIVGPTAKRGKKSAFESPLKTAFCGAAAAEARSARRGRARGSHHTPLPPPPPPPPAHHYAPPILVSCFTSNYRSAIKAAPESQGSEARRLTAAGGTRETQQRRRWQQRCGGGGGEHLIPRAGRCLTDPRRPPG
ncbi:hypothetical protein E2C01_055600 [Portunus trituberculatus]|uniref:Uncharacterized protein n=1 Tax=Portunus trituberculatus TaxID=210409 RepID=A0A5B7GWD4_PORTR|nr:hypothetical protein [Portunus trituberculatus]